jgi:hypothetical protein
MRNLEEISCQVELTATLSQYWNHALDNMRLVGPPQSHVPASFKSNLSSPIM